MVASSDEVALTWIKMHTKEKFGMSQEQCTVKCKCQLFNCKYT